MSEENSTEKLRLLTYVETLQNAIELMLSINPANISEKNEQVLQTLREINEVKCYMKEKAQVL